MRHSKQVAGGVSRREFVTSCGALALATVAGCGREKTAPVEPLIPLRLQLKWLHYSQFAGFYVAAKQEVYRRAGLAVSFIEGGPKVDVLGAVQEGRADVGILGAEDLLEALHRGADLVALAVVFRVNPLVFLVHEDSPIHNPRDFPGKRIAYPGNDGRTQAALLMRRFNPGKPPMIEVPYDREYGSFIKREVDIIGAYATGGLYRLKTRGVAVRPLWPASFGLNWYGDVVFARRSVAEAQSSVIAKFLRASVEGWQMALVDLDLGAQASTLMSGRGAEDELGALRAARPLIRTGIEPLGSMRVSDWQDMQGQLREAGLVGANDHVTHLFAPISLLHS